MPHDVRFENLDKEVVNQVLKEQENKLERLKIDYSFIFTYGPGTSRYATQMQDLEIQINTTENFIKFLQANGNS